MIHKEYPPHIIDLADTLYFKTKSSYDFADLSLLTHAHSYVVNQYVTFRSSEALGYDAKTEKVSGIAMDFHGDDLFQENGKKVFLPEKIIQLIKKPTDEFIPPPVVEKDPGKLTALALTSYCLELGVDQLFDYSRMIQSNNAMEMTGGVSDLGSFLRVLDGQLQEMDALEAISKLDNLNCGVENLLFFGAGQNKHEFANNMGEIVTSLINLSEACHQQGLSKEDIEHITVHRHTQRYDEFSKTINPN